MAEIVCYSMQFSKLKITADTTPVSSITLEMKGQIEHALWNTIYHAACTVVYCSLQVFCSYRKFAYSAQYAYWILEQ